MAEVGRLSPRWMVVDHLGAARDDQHRRKARRHEEDAADPKVAQVERVEFVRIR
jgi:hypothetical protein